MYCSNNYNNLLITIHPERTYVAKSGCLANVEAGVVHLSRYTSSMYCRSND